MILLNWGAGEDCWESPGLQGDQISQSWRKSTLNIHWKNWCWSWSSNIWPPNEKSWLTGRDLDAWKDWGQEEKGMTGWDGWMTSSTQRTWVWANSGRQWRTGKPGVLQSMRSQRVGHDWVAEQKNHLSDCSD